MTCETGKKQFSSKRMARKQMIGGKHSRAYFCEICHNWHITLSRAYGDVDFKANKRLARDNKADYN